MNKLVLLGDASSPHIQRWMGYFIKRDYEIHLISFQAGDIDGVKIHYIRTPNFLIISQITKLWRKIGYLSAIYKVRKLIFSIAPDILHAHWSTSYGLLAAVSGFHPLIISTWGRDIIDSPRDSWILKKVVQYNLSKADVITSTSLMLKKETQKYIQTGQKVHHIPFGIDTEKFIVNSELKDNNTIYIGTVKSLEEKYGISYLIQAFAQVKMQITNVELIIVGVGSLFNKLVKLAESLGINNSITFTGKVENDEVVHYLHKMDIFVVPSISESETFGVAAVEASACGLPVIASNIGGLPEVVIDGKTGFLIDPENIDDLTEKLLILINDKMMRKKMGEEGRNYIEANYRLEECGLMMESVYNELGEIYSNNVQ